MAYFLPDFLMPCWPVFKGPFLPLAASSISFFALAAMSRTVSRKQTQSNMTTHTSLLLLLEGQIFLVQLLLLLLCGPEGLDLAT